ncbi:regulation of carbohydrate metabolism-related protein [Corchorus olitorius]|uniref:Regulation of carbohydrate metabolism-related protein n=1 Tax=Corchorus olitorius TaxID=93759 RepID=A0A1R3JYK1_9ROSI|nr:regulation of carbohydrate metabolism-related protein [Corchorus olitorius]
MLVSKGWKSEEEFETNNYFPTKFVEIEEEIETTTPPLLESAQKDLSFTKDMVPITINTPSQEASVGESECASSIQKAPPHEDSNSKVDRGNSPFVESLGYEDPDLLGVERFLEFESFEDVPFFTRVKMDQFYNENGATKDCKVSYLPRRLLKAEGS